MADFVKKRHVESGAAIKEINRLADYVNINKKAATQAANATANAATQTGSYVQADVQTIATLANALKTDLNALITKLKAGNLMATS